MSLPFSCSGFRRLRGVPIGSFERKGVSEEFSLSVNPLEDGRGGMMGNWSEERFVVFSAMVDWPLFGFECLYG